MPAPLLYRAVCRACQMVLFYAAYILPWWKPRLIQGKDAVLSLPAFLRGKKLYRPLLVTDVSIMQIGLASPLIAKFREEGMSLAVYPSVTPNPTLDQVEAAYALYKQEGCDSIIGFGGGSSMDCAKLVGVRVARPRTPLPWMRGIVKVLWPTPTIVAIPTTAGTGSEVTLAAVVTDPRTHDKYALADPFLVPKYAILDPSLTVGLPKSITAWTGMDTLTHAVEAYLNIYTVPETREAALMAAHLVFNNLKKAYDTPTDIVARSNMMEAAYLGGVAFTRSYVGNVHAIAHALGGFYGVPHGLANALILPHVLEFYCGPAVNKKLATFVTITGHNGSEDEKARAFIQAVRDLNTSVGIPHRLSEAKFFIKEEDIPTIASRAASEANPVYPVPVILSTADFVQIIRGFM